MDPRKQLASRIWLDEVVVGAEVQAVYSRSQVSPCGRHDDRHVAYGSDGGAQLEAVPVGQAEIEQNHLVGVVQQSRGLGNARGSVYRKPMALEHITQSTRNPVVVLNQQQPHELRR